MRFFAAPALAALLAVAACSPPPSGGAIGDPIPSAAGVTPRVAAVAGFDDPGDVDDALDVAMVRPASYRPSAVSVADQAAVIVADLLYDGLTEVDGTGGGLRPGLARRWEADDRFRRWTFHLDPAAGVTADDVVASLEPLTASSANDRARSAAAITAGLASVRAVDDRTVVLDLVRPNAGLPWVLSGVVYSIVGRDGAPTGDYAPSDDGVSGLVIRRRPDRPDPDRWPAEVRIRWVDHPEAAEDLLGAGAVDMAVGEGATPAGPTSGAGERSAATVAVRYFVLNPASDRLDSPERRRSILDLVDPAAVLAAVDRADLIPSTGLVSPSAAGASAVGASVVGACPTCTGEPPAPPASGQPSPVLSRPLRISVSTDDQARMAQALVDQLEANGVAAVWEQVGAGELATRIVDGSADLFAFGWAASAGSVDAVLPPLLRPDSPANVARIASPEVADLLGRAATTLDDETRWALLGRANDHALAEATVLPLAVSAGTLRLAPGLVGVVVRADGSLDLETVTQPPIEAAELLEFGAHLQVTSEWRNWQTR